MTFKRASRDWAAREPFLVALLLVFVVAELGALIVIQLLDLVGWGV